MAEIGESDQVVLGKRHRQLIEDPNLSILSLEPAYEVKSLSLT